MSAGLDATASCFQQRPHNFSHHVTQERFSPDHVDPFVGAGRGPRQIARKQTCRCGCLSASEHFGVVDGALSEPVLIDVFRTRRRRERREVVLADEGAGGFGHGREIERPRIVIDVAPQ